MTAVDLAGLVPDLLQARRERVPTPAAHRRGELDKPTAYSVQRSVFRELHGPQTESVCGYKISLVTERDQRNFGTDSPTCGMLASSDIVAGPAAFPMDELFHPLVEPELVFRLESDLPQSASVEQIIAATVVMAGFEIPDSRYEGWYPVPGQVVTDLIADDSYVGRVIYAEPGLPAADVDLPAVECRLTIDGELFGVGYGVDVLGNPAAPIAWLSAFLAETGDVLRAGQFISSGTFLYPPEARPGEFVADYSGIGRVSARFT